MPELPEVETVRRSLEPRVLGRTIVRVDVRRASVVRGTRPRDRAAALGEGQRFVSTARHGKQLAMSTETGRVLAVHLGMSGQVFVVPRGDRNAAPDHNHVRWLLNDGSCVVFRDPRRFGGIWTFASRTELDRQRWSRLGPDALAVNARQLRAGLGRSRRSIKACLLDQSVVAGVGNIYADEALFLSRLHPETPADMLDVDEIRSLAASVRQVLRSGLAAGGATLRDFRDADLRSGYSQTRFRAYGRAGEPCSRCRTPMKHIEVAQRTTTLCPVCQPIR